MKPGSHKEGHYILAPPFEVDQVLIPICVLTGNISLHAHASLAIQTCHLERGLVLEVTHYFEPMAIKFEQRFCRIRRLWSAVRNNISVMRGFSSVSNGMPIDLLYA